MEAHKIENLTNQWATYREENPKVRIRDAANYLNVSEMELLCSSKHMHVVQLNNKWGEMLLEFKNLGRVMALTRNESVVHERKGIYQNAKAPKKGHIALVLDEEIDLRLFFSQWRFGFAVLESIEDGERRSLHFFDASGAAVHKIYLLNDSNENAFFDITNKYQKEDGKYDFSINEIPSSRLHNSDADIDVTGFQTAWDGMKDTHQFYGLLKRFGVDRMQALRLGGGERAYMVKELELENMLNFSAKRQLEIMVFVSNVGVVQIHTGTVDNVRVLGDWINVLDPEFNLHIKGADIAYVWVVKKPTEDGQVTSLECYDKDENLVVQFFGKRKPGIPECLIWQNYIESLEEL